MLNCEEWVLHETQIIDSAIFKTTKHRRDYPYSQIVLKIFEFIEQSISSTRFDAFNNEVIFIFILT